MPRPDFDPMDGLSDEDIQYLDSHRKAFSRQSEAHASMDEERKRAAQEHMKSVQQLSKGSAMSPSEVVREKVRPSPISSRALGTMSVLIAVPDPSGGLPPTKEKYAPDWNSMKDMISKYDGIWVVSRHEFPSHVSSILGFFGKEGWPSPDDSEKEVFEVIVRGGRVFRTDPE